MRDIEQYEKDYLNNPFESTMVEFRHRKTAETLATYPHGRILEVGCGLEPLYTYFSDFEYLLIVEPSSRFAQAAMAAAPKKVRVINEELKVSQAEADPFDIIVIDSLLHELEHPQAMLETAKAFVGLNTVVHINVPNANSLHRLLAYRMGLIDSVKTPSDRQKTFQQHHTFDMDSLRSLIIDSGFDVLSVESFFIKPFTHAQMQQLIDTGLMDQAMMEGLYELAQDMPDMGAEIVLTARPGH